MSHSNHIFFRQYIDTTYDFMLPQKDSSCLDLENSIFFLLKVIPKNFMISTIGKTYHFNTEMLRDVSSKINEVMDSDPDLSFYHLNIKDKRNVMQKIEQMFIGKEVIFEEEEISTVRKITCQLGIDRCPNFMKTDSLTSKYDNYSSILNTRQQDPFKVPVSLNKISVVNFFKENLNENFTIITKNKKYACDDRSVLLSNVIYENVMKNPSLHEYFYNFEDEFFEFNDVYEIFKFKSIYITSNNINSLKKITEDLQIYCLLDQIREYDEKYEKSIQKIDEDQILINSIEQLFEWLYQIEKLTPETVFDSIINSFWIQTEENVQELVACLLQVIYTNFNYHSKIFELILLLHQAANEANKLRILMPFLIRNLMTYFSRSILNCSFVYKLYKKGFISKQELLNKLDVDNAELRSKSNYYHEKSYYSDQYCAFDKITTPDLPYYLNMTVWFFPELMEKSSISLDVIKETLGDDVANFIKTYYPDHLDEFDRMRESGEPPDELTRSLIHDDINAFQTIISKSGKDIENGLIPFNIFDNFVENGKTSYLNYAAAYGSIKCFKYLLLNHAAINKYTFKYAVFGENSEIIRIVSQKEGQIFKTNENSNNYSFSEGPSQISMLYPAIIKHNAKLFDWIFEKVVFSKNIRNDQTRIISSSFMNGNAHSFIECINKGFNINSYSQDYHKNLLIESTERGFYRFTQLAFHFIHDLFSKPNEGRNAKKNILDICKSSIHSGNLSLFRMYINMMTAFDLDEIVSSFLYEAILHGNLNIIKYFCETEKFETSRKVAIIDKNSHFNIDIYLINSLRFHKFEIFKYLVDNYAIVDIQYVFSQVCGAENLEIIKELTKFIIQNNPNFDFTNPFIELANNNMNEVCQYLIEQKVNLDFHCIISNISKFMPKNEDIFFLLLKIIDSFNEYLFYTLSIDVAVINKHYLIVEYLLKNNKVINDYILIEATNKHDSKMVDLILKYKSNDILFINKISANGTALSIAVKNDDNIIVKRLLSVPGIDPSKYEANGNTPLILAVLNLNIYNIDAIFNFYGEKIQICEINKALNLILEKISANRNSKSEKSTSLLYSAPSISYDNKSKVLPVLNRLLQVKNVDVNICAGNYTLLLYACEINDINFVQILLKSEEIDVNLYAPVDGNTPLIIALKNKNLEIAELLIKSPHVNINQHNYQQETALVIAASNNLEKMVSLIINHESFDPIESHLNYAFFLSKGAISQLLSKVKGLDVNNFAKHVISDNKHSISIIYPLKSSITRLKIEKFDLIISHPSFDIYKSNIKEAVISTMIPGGLYFFKKLLKLVNDDINFFTNEKLLIHAVKSFSGDIISEILNNKTFDSRKGDIVGAFVASITTIKDTKQGPILVKPSFLFSVMNTLYNYDQQHEHLIDFADLVPLSSESNKSTMRKSFFTIIPANIIQLPYFVDFFLKNGVDPNRPDEFGVLPLQHAINIGSLQFVQLLIGSGKIDLSVRLNYNNYKNYTYLHFACQNQNSLILDEILKAENIDINATDDNGNTPLNIAVSNHLLANIQLLFKIDSLDYQHKNNKGENCLEIAMREMRKGRSKRINLDEQNTKYDYLHFLINIFADSNEYDIFD